MFRGDFLDEAKKTICNDRQDVYGSPENSFPVIAKYWETYLSEILHTEIKLTPRNVADLLCLFKLARITTGAYKEDNYVDLCGYSAIAGSLEETKKESEYPELLALSNHLLNKWNNWSEDIYGVNFIEWYSMDLGKLIDGSLNLSKKERTADLTENIIKLKDKIFDSFYDYGLRDKYKKYLDEEENKDEENSEDSSFHINYPTNDLSIEEETSVMCLVAKCFDDPKVFVKGSEETLDKLIDGCLKIKSKASQNL